MDYNLQVNLQTFNELKNIRHMIKLTTENLSNLNRKFAPMQHPPQIYIDEYEQLTTKLNEFQNAESALMEKITGDNSSDQENENHNAQYNSHLDQPNAHNSTQQQSQNSVQHPYNLVQQHAHNSIQQHSPLISQTIDPNQFDLDNQTKRQIKELSNRINLSDLNSNSNKINHLNNSSNNTPPTPKSPFKSIVRANLPNQQRTTVQVRPGQTVKDALSKAMKRRKLTPEMCEVSIDDRHINWDDDVTKYESMEINVKTREKFPISTSISHNFVRKTFFKIPLCEVCQALLFQGFRCQTCNFKFHHKCAPHVPPLCEPLRYHSANHSDVYYRHLLAMDNHENVTPAPNTHQVNRQSIRERSTSAPNVNTVNQNPPGPMLEEYFHSLNAEALSAYPHSATDAPPSYQMQENQFQKLSQMQHQENIRIHSVGGSPTNNGHINSSINDQNENQQSTRPRAKSADDNLKKDLIKEEKWKVRCNKCEKFNDNCEACLAYKSLAPQGLMEKIEKLKPNEDFEILRREIRPAHKIGSGSFGTVYHGFWHGSKIALKKLNVKNPTLAQLNAFKNEVSVLKKTRHVNIVLFMGCVSKRENLIIVTQWCEGSSLFKHLHLQDHVFDIRMCIEISKQTAQGMDYLHAKNIIHRDLKSQNIFLTEDMTVKIGDFGLAAVKTKWQGPQFTHPTGSVLWMAPEIIKMKDNDAFSFKSDVYAYGIVLYEVFAQELPYRRNDGKISTFENQLILYLVAKGELKPDLTKIRSDIPKMMLKVLEDCIKYDRDDRPLFKEVLTRIDSFYKTMPKKIKSFSEPTLNRTNLNDYDIFDHNYEEPITPHARFDTFQFYDNNPSLY